MCSTHECGHYIWCWRNKGSSFKSKPVSLTPCVFTHQTCELWGSPCAVRQTTFVHHESKSSLSSSDKKHIWVQFDQPALEVIFQQESVTGPHSVKNKSNAFSFYFITITFWKSIWSYLQQLWFVSIYQTSPCEWNTLLAGLLQTSSGHLNWWYK